MLDLWCFEIGDSYYFAGRATYWQVVTCHHLPLLTSSSLFLWNTKFIEIMIDPEKAKTSRGKFP